MKKSVFADLKVTRVPQKCELEIFAEDKQLMVEFWEFKQRQMGGEIPFAEVFSRLARVVFQDSDFASQSCSKAGAHTKRNRESKKTDETLQNS